MGAGFCKTQYPNIIVPQTEENSEIDHASDTDDVEADGQNLLTANFLQPNSLELDAPSALYVTPLL
jgi:hypothetical protein